MKNRSENSSGLRYLLRALVCLSGVSLFLGSFYMLLNY